METALRELQSKGDIDEALRREEEAKQALEQSQKEATSLQETNERLQKVVASTSTRSEQLQKTVEELTATSLSLQQQVAALTKQSEEAAASRAALESQVAQTRSQAAAAAQQLAQYKASHPAVTTEELAELRSSASRLQAAETELATLKQKMTKGKKGKGKGKPALGEATQPLTESQTPSLFPASSVSPFQALKAMPSGSLALQTSETSQSSQTPSGNLFSSVAAPSLFSSAASSQSSQVANAAPQTVSPFQAASAKRAGEEESLPQEKRRSFSVPSSPSAATTQPLVSPTAVNAEAPKKKATTSKEVALLQAAYMCSKYFPDKTKLRDTVMQAINSKDDKCSFTSFMTKIFNKTKLDENAIADIRSIKSPDDYTKKLEVS